MALPAVMSEKALAKFHTKVCERILATGTCDFGDKCQYSHAPRPRRNPRKHLYTPKLCSNANNCARGALCGFAHTLEEERYHPLTYKTVTCPRDASCLGFYCPFAHSAEELKKLPEEPLTTPPPPSPSPGGDAPSKIKALDAQDYWFAGDQEDLRVSQKEMLSRSNCHGQVLIGGKLRQGFFAPCPGHEVAVAVKLLPVSRGDSSLAQQVVTEIKRWVKSSPLADGSVVRRTVATTVLAMPVQPSTLGQSVTSFRSSLAEQIKGSWCLAAVAAQWVRDLLEGLRTLHNAGICHLCLGPATVNVDKAGSLQIGDFLGKMQALRYLESGWHDPRRADEDWAIWYPPEVLECVSAAGTEKSGKEKAQAGTLDHGKVDAWQLGIVIFFLLTGKHPFGDCHDPATVFKNIAMDQRHCLDALRECPLFLDFVMRLTNRDAKSRRLPSELFRHPLLWSLQDAAKLTAPFWASSGPILPLWIRHIPSLAVLGARAMPPTPQVDSKGLTELVARLCDQAMAMAEKAWQAPKKGQRPPPPVAAPQRNTALQPAACSPAVPAGQNPSAPPGLTKPPGRPVQRVELAALTAPGLQVLGSQPPSSGPDALTPPPPLPPSPLLCGLPARVGLDLPVRAAAASPCPHQGTLENSSDGQPAAFGPGPAFVTPLGLSLDATLIGGAQGVPVDASGTPLTGKADSECPETPLRCGITPESTQAADDSLEYSSSGSTPQPSFLCPDSARSDSPGTTSPFATPPPKCVTTIRSPPSVTYKPAKLGLDSPNKVSEFGAGTVHHAEDPMETIEARIETLLSLLDDEDEKKEPPAAEEPPLYYYVLEFGSADSGPMKQGLSAVEAGSHFI